MGRQDLVFDLKWEASGPLYIVFSWVSACIVDIMKVLVSSIWNNRLAAVRQFLIIRA
jgi:hypothetical protein